MVDQFTLGEETYIPFNNSLLRVVSSVTNLEDVEKDTLYLYDGIVVQFDRTFDSKVIYFPQSNHDNRRYVDEDSETSWEDFSGAKRLERVVPDSLEKCPNCGAAAGEKDNSDTPTCFQCGYGTEDGLYKNRPD